jgi:NADPH:quinone reductase-like Zn-dependent oxidoreductase
MKAVQFAEYGGPEVLHLVETAEPHPGPGRIRIAVRAAGVNGLEWKIRQGLLRDDVPLTLPAGVGGDASGVVDEIGDGVDDARIGDAVFGSGACTYAERAVLTSWAHKPASVTFEEAAGYPVPFETAFRVLDAVGLSPGRTLLVSGASGGVGSVVVQVAVHRGLRVIGTAGRANHEYLTSLGAVATTYGDDLVERVRALAPDGVDAALDIAGSGVVPDLVAMTGDPTRVVSIADFGAPAFGARVSTGFGGDKSPALRAGADLVVAGALRLPVERTFALSEAGDAQAASARGHVRGRLVVTVA